MASFTHRHYESLASVINRTIRLSEKENLDGWQTATLMANSLIKMCEQDNARFKPERFIKTSIKDTQSERPHPIAHGMSQYIR
jgi:hypothetical protein